MANNKNLIPINKRTKNEQRELQSKAGKASGKSRRAKKAVKAIIEELLNSSVTDYPQTAKLAVKLGLDDDKSSYYCLYAEHAQQGKYRGFGTAY